MEPVYFATPDEFRRWFDDHHASAAELWVGYYKKGSGRPSITWPESVDEALCVGWIDGLRKSIDSERYKIRFTPRRATSIWSAVNTKRMAELIAAGRVRPAGRTAFEGRSEARTGVYSYEQRESAKFDAATEKQFRTHKKAWKYFQAQSPWYRRTTTWWVVSAKRAETREKRLAMLIECCEREQPLPRMLRPPKAKKPEE
jgi:uncharacterized protein YdeI (YjbR/CyaY-like superfamily)